MDSTAANPQVAAALDALDAAVAALQGFGDLAVDAADAVVVCRVLEGLGRRVASVQVGLVGEIDRRRLHKADGHASAKVMVRHVANLSEPEAARRARCARALRDLPAVAAAFAGGHLGRCQVERIARTHANPRVREQFVRRDAEAAAAAARASYLELDRLLANWEAMVDEDGARDRNQRHHDHRDAALVQDLDGSWQLRGSWPALAGAQLHDVFKAFISDEFAADWAAARARHGDATTIADLARTDAQRRADAIERIFERAAACRAATPGGQVVSTMIVMDHATFEHNLRLLTGAPEPEPGLDPAEVGLDLRRAGTDIGYRCSTLDGHPLEPTEATLAALLNTVRRAVIDAHSVTIDLGRSRRLFTGPAQLAARLAATTCIWPGCHVPTTACQTDHLQPWDHGGPTNPANGAPLCGRHNRHKHNGPYTIEHHPDGTWHTTRPDGTEIT